MSARDFIAELVRIGVRLEARGDRLRFWSELLLSADVIERLTAEKEAVLAELALRARSKLSIPKRGKLGTGPPCRYCGSTQHRDFAIHDDQSIRRDCAQCKRFLDFPVWYSIEAETALRSQQNHIDTGHDNQHLLG